MNRQTVPRTSRLIVSALLLGAAVLIGTLSGSSSAATQSQLGIAVAGPSVAPMGSSINWSITLTNGGASPTGAIDIEVRLEDAADGVVSSTEAGCSATADTFECDVAPIAAGATRVLNFTTILARREFDTQHNIRVDEFGGTVSRQGFNTTTFDPANPPDARVSNVSVVAVAGEPGVFDVTWRIDNDGGRAVIEWAMAIGESVFIASVPGGCSLQSMTVFCGAFVVNAGASLLTGVRVRAGGLGVSISVGVRGPQPDKDTTNNYVSAFFPSGGGGGGSSGGSNPPPSPPTTASPGSVDASVSLTANKLRVAPGDRVSVRARVLTSNYTPPSGGPPGVEVPSRRLLLRVVLPKTFALVSTTPDGPPCTGTRIVECEAGLVSRTSPYGVQFLLQAKSGAASVFRASLDQTAIGPDSNPANNVATLELTPWRAVNRSGTAGPDTLRGTPLGDRLDGRGGRDSILGLGGDDVLVGGAGVDSIHGGTGADRVESRDGERDTVVCGPGRDFVIADLSDRIARDCELVRRR